MPDVTTLSPAAQAGVLVGAILVEAIILYVGYGIAEQVVGERLLDRIKST